MPSPQPSDLPLLPRRAMEALRAATASQHRRMEALVRLEGAFGRDHYGHVLQAFASFLRDWERRIALVLPPHLQSWFAEGCRHGLAERDLGALGVAPSALQASLPDITGLAQALGSLYVLEGSALGGEVIAQRVFRTLGIGPEDGGAYFHGCGQGTGARWRQFRELAASELDADALAQADAVDAAVRTFDALIATFQDCLHERATA